MNLFGLQLPAWVNYIWGPLIGAIIGLITNGIAIRMLFRPLHPVKIGSHTLPFTPGIIPKEKPRLARSCGRIVGETLINEEVLSATLLSEEMDSKIMGIMDTLVERYKDSPLSVYEIITKALDETQTDLTIDRSKTFLTNFVYDKACSMAIGDKVGQMAVNEIKKNPTVVSLMTLFGSEALNTIHEKISEVVNEMIVSQGKDIIAEYIDKEADTLLSLRLCDLYEHHGYKLSQVEAAIIDAYHYLITKCLARILTAIDLPQLVEDRINSFDVAELEVMVLEIMNKELKAIVWLGGLLGLIMGFIMIFV